VGKENFHHVSALRHGLESVRVARWWRTRRVDFDRAIEPIKYRCLGLQHYCARPVLEAKHCCITAATWARMLSLWLYDARTEY
jgi:hypothetical protein